MSEKLIIACPDCETRFIAPLEKFLPNGRRVRCAKCGHAWFHEVVTDTSEIAEAQNAAEAVSDNRPELNENAPPSEEARSEPARSEEAGNEETRSEETSYAATPPPLPPVEDTSEGRAALEEASAESIPEGTSELHESFSEEKSGVGSFAASATAATAATAAATATAATSAASSTASAAKTAATERLPRKPRRWGWLRAVLYCLAALIIIAVLAYFFREPISKRFPSLAAPLSNYSERVDRVVSSVTPSTQPTKIENVTYKLIEIENGQAMLLTAEVSNSSDAPIDAPKLQMKAMGGDNTVLHEAVFAPEDINAEKINPNDKTVYFLRIPQPPEGIERVEVDFVK